MKGFRFGLMAAAALLMPMPGMAQDRPLTAAEPRDWAATLRSDARGFHDLIAADLPGPYNRLDRGFA